ncbi:MAG: LysR family transcriptional regulator [Burkholderiales bacterium PBB5]|nr:MAG: LysR family transcriptional regulator [Burkholderiales bacterium PBB5]
MEHLNAFIIFAKVGELGSISAAARALGLPKVRVSRAVSGLEAVYKVKLLDRTTRSVTLTEVGRTLHARCLHVREEVEEAEAEVAAHRGQPAGTLRIGCPGDIAPGLTPYLHEFMEKYPEIDLRIRVGERLLPEPNRLDVVLHSGWLTDSRLTVRKIVDVRTLLVASGKYIEAHGLPLAPDDLDGHAIIGNFYLDPAAVEPGRLPARVPPLELVRGNERHRLPTWRRFASTDHGQILELVRRGSVIAPLAASAAIAGLQSGELVRVLPDYEIAEPPALYALYTDRAALVPKLRVFLEFVVSVAQKRFDELTVLLAPFEHRDTDTGPGVEPTVT